MGTAREAHMCCTPVSLWTFLLLMIMVSGLGDVLIESIGDAVDRVFESRPLRARTPYVAEDTNTRSI